MLLYVYCLECSRCMQNIYGLVMPHKMHFVLLYFHRRLPYDGAIIFICDLVYITNMKIDNSQTSNIYYNV